MEVVLNDKTTTQKLNFSQKPTTLCKNEPFGLDSAQSVVNVIEWKFEK